MPFRLAVKPEKGLQMKRWLSCELSRNEWEKVRTFVLLNDIKYEASGVGMLIHAEMYVNEVETRMVNDFIDTL